MTVASRAATEHEVACLLVETLNLEITAEEINADEALFGEGLGLDSIDALELALAISRTYGLELTSETARERHVFASLRSLTAYIQENRTR